MRDMRKERSAEEDHDGMEEGVTMAVSARREGTA